ncbi:MAG: hypothetical protein A3I44_02710 [Candidatus Sungbacteria bacterium RIFCSPLOWO2_02_FULL_51_17]|uniref:Uncharacterized protein n=1 Tax=Candidatus Sungbacteria bacterium RIFCSPHIGHO2_02_FULL_51_29 TaxID=1802273 RepID=A0A1G2KU41_9BACT|nr:MAG: hypothetical protein A2676_06080 [Candidatus Sungbacteria bacterium RIFCSPHIGHO2_01_FULL_51_22]OHA02960.1 MAG: hypothetical protein A3C16_05820 [Candidatus Sungbacteria bacterium RIFCSPHIGHO2_02_FULL_51_29]OHA10810.1 MAG: hypothetical protein A3I44_02710 [Candidatus Sungbacteria bacterium RIFCSPLOWO2_02_FULL_51_17]
MNNELYEIIKVYATKDHKELTSLLLDKSKDQLIALFNDLITIYINDKNSSLLREYITVSLAGYTPTNTKIGYNGFKQSTQIGGKVIACEAKPQNLHSEDNGKRKSPRRLNGGGNFTDYTHERFAKDKKENPSMLISGFVDGELIYVLEFPFTNPSFVKRLKTLLKKRFPNGRKAGNFLRSANFTFEHYKSCKELNIVYLQKDKLEKHKRQLTEKYYTFLFKKVEHVAKR